MNTKAFVQSQIAQINQICFENNAFSKSRGSRRQTTKAMKDSDNSQNQAFCFVSSYSGDLIPPEAVMKLRQKNPTTVRVADEDRGEVVQDSPLKIVNDRGGMAVISSHLAHFCR